MSRSLSRRWLVRRALQTLLGILLGCALLLGGTAAIILSRFGGSALLPVDCAVVFGAAVYGSRPSGAIIRRMTEAVTLYREKQIKTLFLTGGKGMGDERSEADVMRMFALGNGVRERDITIEPRARSTWENLLFTRPLTGSCATVIGISDAYHLARIELLARRQGWGTLRTHPAERPDRRSERRSLVREVEGYLYYLLRTDKIWNIAPTATLEDAGILEPGIAD